MIGLLMMQLAKLAGAAKVALIEPVEEKRNVAKDLGADLTIDPFHQDAKQVLRNNGFNWIQTVIECAGLPSTCEQAIALADHKAVVMLFGLTKPDEIISVRPFEIFQKEIELKASFINPCTQKRTLDLIDSHRLYVSGMVYKVCCLEELENILKDSSLRTKGKFIINPQL